LAGAIYSRYITSDEYYYTLIRYIEQNPIEADLATEVGKYPCTLGAAVVNRHEIIPCAQDSKLISELEYENIQEIIGVKPNEDDLEILNKIQKQKVVVDDKSVRLAYSKTLDAHFKEAETKAKRNSAIIKALKDGYTQAQIAKQSELSRSLISKVVKSKYSTPDP